MGKLLGTTVIALALVASACGGKASPETTATQAAATQAAATTAPTIAPTPAPTAAPTADPGQALLDLIKAGKGSAYKVTYTLTTVTSGKTTSGTYSLAWKPPFFRVDMSLGPASGAAQSFTTITRPEGTFLCAAITGAPACYSYAAGSPGAAGIPTAPQPIPSDFTGWGLTPAGSKTVVGTETRCYSFKAPAGTAASAAGDTTGCFTSQGVPLYVSSKAGGSDITMEATSFSTTVSDADFALPYPVEKLPGQP